jgi:hypothetical protein
MELQIGDRVKYYSITSNYVGTGVIDEIGEKNGMVVYDVQLDNGDLRWGYVDQFKRV